MHIDALKIYCDVIRFRSFSRGADANNVLQATASQTVHRLEDHLGVRLIDRSCRPLEATKEGKIFFEGCRDIVARYAEVEAAVRGTRASVDSVIRVAAIYSASFRDVSSCVQQFNAQRPQARVEVEFLHPDRVCERVLSDEVNLGILSFPDESLGLAVIPWREEMMVLACHPDNPLASHLKVEPRQMAGQTFIGFDTDLVIGKKIERYLRNHGVEPKIALRFDNIEAIKRAIEVGSGVAILPRPTLEHELQLGTLSAVSLAGPKFVRPLGIVFRRGRPLYANTEAFINLLKNGGANGGRIERSKK